MAIGHSSVWADVREEDGNLVLVIGGELDSTSRPSIEPAVLAAIASTSAVTFDLRDLAFCDSNGIAMLIEATLAADTHGCTLTVRNTKPSIRRVFDIAALGELLEIVD